MALPSLSEIEAEFARLAPEAELSLLERLVGRTGAAVSGRHTWESELTAMASDPEVQRELKDIHAEFAATEADGLETR